jgi:hypothetical protein
VFDTRVSASQRSLRGALLCVLCFLGALAGSATAQTATTLKTDLTFYGDNTEFTNRFRDGETILGNTIRLYADVTLNDRVTLLIGAMANGRFGDECVIDLVRPVLSLVLKRGGSRFIFGTLQTMERRDGAGPDRSGPHGLLPPLQVETLSFTRPYEAGLQWTADASRIRHDAWINWQRLNTSAHRERFDAGVTTRARIASPLWAAFQWHLVHHGGQLHASGPVADSQAYGPGIILERAVGAVDKFSVEAYGLISRHVPDRERPFFSRSGIATLTRIAAERRAWRGHLLIWRSCDFVKEEGDSNYWNRRMNGTRYRLTRDYSEVGVTRTFRPAAEVGVETAARLHRVEGDYDYSFRILAVVKLGWRIH